MPGHSHAQQHTLGTEALYFHKASYHNQGHVLFYKKADKDTPFDKLIVLWEMFLHIHHIYTFKGGF